MKLDTSDATRNTEASKSVQSFQEEAPGSLAHPPKNNSRKNVCFGRKTKVSAALEDIFFGKTNLPKPKRLYSFEEGKKRSREEWSKIKRFETLASGFRTGKL